MSKRRAPQAASPERGTGRRQRVDLALYRGLFEQAPMGMALSDGAGRLIDVNPALCSLFGRSREALLEQPASDLAPEHGEELDERIAQVARGSAGPCELETRIPQADGDSRSVRLRIHPPSDPGASQGAVLYVEDIEELRRAEEARVAAEARFQSFFEQAPLAMALQRPDGSTRAVNPGFVKLWNIDPDAVETILASYNIREDEQLDRLGLREAVDRAFRGEPSEGPLARFDPQSSPALEKAGSAAGEPRWIRTLMFPICDARGEVREMVLINEDFTERVSLEQQLRQSQKLDAIDRLAGGVAHEFNNVLTVVVCNLEVALASLPARTKAAECLSTALGASRRAGRLTGQLLAFARQAGVDPAQIGPREVLEDVTGLLAHALDPEIELQTDVAPDAWAIRGDPGAVTQLLMNLCINGRDALRSVGLQPAGGQRPCIRIDVANTSFSQQDIADVVGARPGEFVRITVSDNGPGIPPELRDRIFDPFFTTKGEGEGTGLGLSVVRGIAEQQDGWVDVVSQPDAGAHFTVYMPRSKGPARGTLPAMPTGEPVRGDETVLVVDDEAAVREAARQALEACGFHVLLSSSGIAAVDVLSEADGPIDLVVLDLRMSGGSGRDVLAWMHERRAESKVLVISGHGALADWQELQRLGARAFLPKPFGPADLARAVRTVLDED